jgi:hypothetical protein
MKALSPFEGEKFFFFRDLGMASFIHGTDPKMIG